MNPVAQRAALQTNRLVCNSRLATTTSLPACQRFFTTSDRVPETHVRSFGQPTPMTHPNIMKKGEGKMELGIERREGLADKQHGYSDTWFVC